MSKPVYLTASVDIDIPFHDCDPMQIVWHGNYARYLEVARCVLLDKINYDYLSMHESGYSWPIVDMRIKYISSARFKDTIKVTASLVEYESRIKIEYVIENADSGQRITKASTVQVAVDAQTNEMQYTSPTVFLEKLEGKLNAE